MMEQSQKNMILLKRLMVKLESLKLFIMPLNIKETMHVLGEGNSSNINFKTTVNDVEEINYIKSVDATS